MQQQNEQSKKTWQEPELLNLDVEGGNNPDVEETNGTPTSFLTLHS